MRSITPRPSRRWLATAAVPLVAFAFAPFVAQADRHVPKPTPPALQLANSAPASADHAAGWLLFEENLGQHAEPVRYKMFGGAVFLTDRAEACMLVEVGREPLWRPQGKAAQNPLWRKAPESRPIYRVLRMQPVERETGRPVPPVPSEGLLRSPIKLSYCKGERSKWRSNVPLYRQVVYHNVYAGIDLVYYPKDERLTYDFRVAPGADPSAIRLHIDGADRLALDREGNLQCFVAGRTVVMQKPTLYQDIAGERRLVPGRFIVDGDDVAFEVGAYDRSLALVIDPVLPFYSTYFGGNQDDQAVGVAVGRAYNRGATTAADVFTSPNTIPVFIGGTTFSPSLPVPVGSGSNANTPVVSPDVDVFVARFEFRADGNMPGNLTQVGIAPSQRFAPWNDFINGSSSAFTYDDRGAERGLAAVVVYGGSGDDVCTGVSVNASYNGTENVTSPSNYFRPSLGPALVGYTTSTNFPTGRQGLGNGSGTTFQASFGGGATDAFALLLPFCLDSAANNITTDPITYSTYIGGAGDDIAWACAAEQGGSAEQFVFGGETTGSLPTGSASGPVFDNTYGGGDADGFVARFNPEQNTVSAQRRYLTYFGGNDYDAVTGVSDFNTSTAATGLTLSNPEANFINGSSSAVSSAVSGATRNGAIDAFVVVFIGNTGPTRDFSTYLGGNSDDWGIGIAVRRRTVDGDNRYVVNVAGLTNSATTGFGISSLTGAFSAFNKGGRDAFITQIRWDGPSTSPSPVRTVQYFGYLGTPGDDDAYALATSNQAGPTNSVVYVGGCSDGPTLFSPVGIASCPSSVLDMLYPTPLVPPPPPPPLPVPQERGFLARISAVDETGSNLPAQLQNLVNVGGRTFVPGAQPIQYVLSVAPYLVTGNTGVLFFAGTTNTNALLPSAPPLSIGPISCSSPSSIPFNVFQPVRANNTSDRKDAFLGSLRLTP
ncbi:MAG: hypothetical protein NZ585_02130 [Chloracidobacterium sp.]|nr:hypothetical protein [Chloracidobacterium sp.]